MGIIEEINDIKEKLEKAKQELRDGDYLEEGEHTAEETKEELQELKDGFDNITKNVRVIGKGLSTEKKKLEKEIKSLKKKYSKGDSHAEVAENNKTLRGTMPKGF